MEDYTKGFLITLAGVIIISPDTLLIRLIESPTLTQLFWRGLLSGLAILFGCMLVSRKRLFQDFKAMGWMGIGAAIIFASGTFCFVYSATHTFVANTLFITATAPVFAALIATVFLKEPVGKRTWLTILATLFGIAIIASGSISRGGVNILGDLAALGAALSLACTFSISRARKTVSMVPAMGLSGLITCLFAWFLAPDIYLPPNDVLWMGLMGLVVTPVATALLVIGPRYLPAPEVSLLMLLEAVFGPILVWIVLTEYPGDRTLIGGAIMLTALSVSSVLANRKPA